MHLEHFGHDCNELKVQNNSRVVLAAGTPLMQLQCIELCCDTGLLEGTGVSADV